MAGPSPGWQWICLMGNHEATLVELVKFPEIGMPRFIVNGGGATLASYGTSTWAPGEPLPIPAAHVTWLAGLPLMHVDLHRVYVHAAVDRWRPLHRQREQTLLWDIYPEDDHGGHGDFHIVHGHQQVAEGPVLKKYRTNLDTFAWRTGRLVVGMFDDEQPGGPVDFVEVAGNHDRVSTGGLTT